MVPASMLAFSDTYLLISDNGYATNNFKSLNVNTGQIVSSVSHYYVNANFAFSDQNSRVYVYSPGSPRDIYHIVLDEDSGEIGDIIDSPYHGDYSLGSPMRIINNGTRIATSMGHMFISSTLDIDDMTYAGSLEFAYIDIVSDDSEGKLYAIANESQTDFLVVNQDTFFTEAAIELLGTPKQIFNTNDNILVFTDYNGDIFVRVFEKANLLSSSS
jgi:hypothetical protein